MIRVTVIFVLNALLLTSCKLNFFKDPKPYPREALSKEGSSDLTKEVYTDFGPYRRMFLSCRVGNSCVDYLSPVESYDKFLEDEAAFDQDCKRAGGSVEKSLSLQTEPKRRNYQYVTQRPCEQKQYGCLEILADGMTSGESLYRLVWRSTDNGGSRCYWKDGAAKFEVD